MAFRKAQGTGDVRGGGEERWVAPTRLGLPDKIQGMEWDILIIKMTFVYLKARFNWASCIFFSFLNLETLGLDLLAKQTWGWLG